MGLVSSFHFSEILVLVYRNTSDFCMSILYLANLLNSLIRSLSFWVETLGFSIYKIMSSSNQAILTFSFIILTHFISFTCLNAMLNRIGRCGDPCLVPYHKRKIFILSLLNMMLTVSLSFMAFIILKYIPSRPNFLGVFFFFIKINVEFHWDNHMIIFFRSINVTLMCLLMLSHLCVTGINPTSSW